MVLVGNNGVFAWGRHQETEEEDGDGDNDGEVAGESERSLRRQMNRRFPDRCQQNRCDMNERKERNEESANESSKDFDTWTQRCMKLRQRR